MILEFYLIFTITAWLLVVIGWYMKVDFLRVLGFFFVMLTGWMLLPTFPGTVEYQSGTNITVNGSLYEVTNIYSVFESHTFGFWIMIIGALGLFTVWTSRIK